MDTPWKVKPEDGMTMRLMRPNPEAMLRGPAASGAVHIQLLAPFRHGILRRAAGELLCNRRMVNVLEPADTDEVTCKACIERLNNLRLRAAKQKEKQSS